MRYLSVIGGMVVSVFLLTRLSDANEPKRPSSVEVRYDVPTAARVSLGVYDRDGRLVRTLLTGKPHTVGQHSATWDGLDRYGAPLPLGEYTWKLVATPGLRAEFITQIGQNVDPVWERATGNHEAPSGAAIDETGLYRVGATNEGAHYAVKTDLNGRQLWTTDRWAADPWAQGTVAVTLVNGRLFELLPNGDLYGYDAKTGRVFTAGNFDPKPWNLGWQGYQAPSSANDEQRRRLRAKECPRDLASDSDKNLIVAAYPQYDAISWYSASDGKLVDTYKGLKQLAGIAVGKGSQVFAIVDGAVVIIDREQKTAKPLIAADQLQNPWRLAVDSKSGDLVIAENSSQFPDAKAHHQVKRFDSAGRLKASYGRPAGRTDGAYQPADYRGITDVEMDAQGGFIITEGSHTPPRRTARFDASGKLIREWFGAQHYGVIACPEPNDPRFVWTLANAPQPGLIRWEIDYTQKSWRVAEIYQDVFIANPFATVPTVPLLFQRDGKIYIQGGALEPHGIALLIYDPQTKSIRPRVASGKRMKSAYLWTDQNEDGQSTEDEVVWLKGHRLGGWIDPVTLNLYTTPVPTDYNAGGRYDPVRILPGGTPVYPEKPTAQLPIVAEGGGMYRPSDYRRDPLGNLFGCFADSAKNPNEGSENHGAWYYNSCSAVDRLIKWDASGKQLWSVGRHSPDNDHEVGSTAMARGLVGITHDCIIWGDASDEEAARPTVWTNDGLYVDELLRLPIDTLPKELYGTFNANEYPCGRLHTDPKTGEVLYFALNSGGGAPIYRITGWNDWHRQEGKIVLKDVASSVAKRDGVGLTGEYFNNADCSGKPSHTRTDAVLYFNWGRFSPHESITADDFSVRWTGQYEATTNEDLRFELRGSFPWRDRGRPTWAKLWIGGQLVIDTKTGLRTGESTFNQDGSNIGTVRVRLSAGQRVDIKLECGFKKGQAAIALSHDTPSLDRRVVLPEFLHPKTSGQNLMIEVITTKHPALVARFDFDDQDAALIWSRAGGDVFGRLTGNAKRVPGRSGTGIELTGQGEFAPALFPIDEELRLPDTEYAIAFWFRTNDVNLRLCEAKRYTSYNNRWSDHHIAIEGGKLRFQLRDDQALESAQPLNDGKWHHVVTTVGEGGQKLYIDGQLQATGKLRQRTTRSNRLGLNIGPGEGRGTVIVDDLVIFGKVPSAAEIAKLAGVGQ